MKKSLSIALSLAMGVTLLPGAVLWSEGRSMNYEMNESLIFGAHPTLRFYWRLCNEGRKFSCRRLADHFYYGIGVEKNLELAFKYYNKACSFGDRLSCVKAEGIMRGWKE
jgi:TPR repeat protein